MRSDFFVTPRCGWIIPAQGSMLGEYSSASDGIGGYRAPPRSMSLSSSSKQEYPNGIIDGIGGSAIKEDKCKGVTAR
jgi:hypothetical protein